MESIHAVQEMKSNQTLEFFALQPYSFTPQSQPIRIPKLNIDSELLISIQEAKKSDLGINSPHISNIKQRNQDQEVESPDVSDITTKKSRSEPKQNLQSTLQNKYDQEQTQVVEFPHLKLDMARE